MPISAPLLVSNDSSPLEVSEVLSAGLDIFLSSAVITGVVALYMLYQMLRPIFEEGDISAEEWNRLEDDSMALLRRRDRVISELKEIEFEAEMNKISVSPEEIEEVSNSRVQAW